MKTLLVGVLLLVSSVPGRAAEGTPAAWTPEFHYRIRRIATVVPSPNGRWVAYLQSPSSADDEPGGKATHLFLASADGSWRKQLTRGGESDYSPVFSPDSRFVYFSGSRSGKANVWRIPLEGGEAERITDLNDGVGNWAVSPDGAWIAFTETNPPPVEQDQKTPKSDARVIDDKPRFNSLWQIRVEPDASGKRVPAKIFGGSFIVAFIDWSPDGRHIAFTTREPGPSGWKKTHIAEVEVATGKMRMLADSTAAESSPLYSPDGRYLAFLRSSVPAHWAQQQRIVVLPRGGGPARELSPTFDEWPTLVGWTKDSSRVLFTEGKGTGKLIGALPLDGQPATIYQPERGYVEGAWTGGGTLVGFSMESWDKPPEAYVMPLAGGLPVRVSRANDDLPKLPLGETRVIRWKSKDGLEIEGLLTLPVGYEAGKKYALIVLAHGGPANAFLDRFIGSPAEPVVYPYGLFAAKGYASLRCNVRGSSGYGKKFRWANIGDWGGGDFEDLMAGVDHVIAMGVADPDRLAVMGSSYGGFMTSWAIGHTKRFKAAAAFAGVTNLWSFTGSTDIPDFMPDWLGAEPWQNFETYRKHSPMAYASEIVTPTLILHGADDERVPISQSYELYNALKRRSVPAKLVIYPRSGHGIGESKLMLDCMRRHLEWLEIYLR